MFCWMLSWGGSVLVDLSSHRCVWQTCDLGWPGCSVEVLSWVKGCHIHSLWGPFHTPPFSLTPSFPLSLSLSDPLFLFLSHTLSLSLSPTLTHLHALCLSDIHTVTFSNMASLFLYSHLKIASCSSTYVVIFSIVYPTQISPNWYIRKETPIWREAELEPFTEK